MRLSIANWTVVLREDKIWAVAIERIHGARQRMAIMSTIDTAGDREYVIRTLTAIIRHAESDADNMARFLIQKGYKPRRSARSPVNYTTPDWVKPFFAHLAAAIRLGMWERAGLTSRLPEAIPSAAEVYSTALRIPHEPSTAISDDVPSRVFQIWFKYFARTESSGIGDNIVVQLHSDILDQVAEFLLSLQAFPKTTPRNEDKK
jgi:hypothetical protein